MLEKFWVLCALFDRKCKAKWLQHSVETINGFYALGSPRPQWLLCPRIVLSRNVCGRRDSDCGARLRFVSGARESLRWAGGAPHSVPLSTGAARLSLRWAGGVPHSVLLSTGAARLSLRWAGGAPTLCLSVQEQLAHFLHSFWLCCSPLPGKEAAA